MTKELLFPFRQMSIWILFTFLFTNVYAQEKRNENFRSPLDIPLYLAGNFGELRSNHFHTGIDIKTQGVEGKAVYAIESGYISRIKISTGGYGKAIYITHPNGYTSVYGHLLKGSERIEAYIQQKQYAKKSFTIEVFPGKGELSLEKGELFAYTGNTGSSGGPHLHFEIRESASEEAVNPLLFGFPIQDNIRPIISGVRLYTLNEESFISPYSPNSLAYTAVGSYGNYHLKDSPRIEAYGQIGFAINTYDLLNGYPNKCGVYKIELRVDSELVFETEFEKLNFSHLRYINTYLDYPLYRNNKKRYHKQFIGENNLLKIYSTRKNNGIIEFNDGKAHKIEYHIVDTYGNSTSLSFEVFALKQIPIPIRREQNQEGKTLFTVKGPNFYQNDAFILDVPYHALYDDMVFTYEEKASLKNTYGPVYVIGNEDFPLQKNFSFIIKENPVPEKYQDKACFVMIEKDGSPSYMGGKIIDGKMTLKSRYFGSYSLMVDTVSPKIKPLNIAPNKDMSSYNTFTLKISDELSGISDYSGKIDGQWILMEYDTKKETLTYRFDNERISKGRHVFTLYVSDEKGNMKNYEAAFIR
jgi:hypothetical protein